jgi:hypothetical protein
MDENKDIEIGWIPRKWISKEEAREIWPHPWGEFLKARIKCIKWLKEEMKRNDEEIAHDLSMDITQVILLRKHSEKYIDG